MIAFKRLQVTEYRDRVVNRKEVVETPVVETENVVVKVREAGVHAALLSLFNPNSAERRRVTGPWISC